MKSNKIFSIILLTGLLLNINNIVFAHETISTSEGICPKDHNLNKNNPINGQSGVYECTHKTYSEIALDQAKIYQAQLEISQLTAKYIPFDINKVPQNVKDNYFISQPVGELYNGQCVIGSKSNWFGLGNNQDINSSLQTAKDLSIGDKLMRICVVLKSDKEDFLKDIGKAIKETEFGGSYLPPSLTSINQEVRPYEFSIEIPCQPIAGGTCSDDYRSSIAVYISRIYQFFLMIAGLAAFGMIVYGGLRYTLSAGNIGSQEDAKEQITQAIVGLILLFGAYLILYTINPDLITLQDPNVSYINVNELLSRIGGDQLDGIKEDHPYCKTGTYTGITINTNIKFDGIKYTEVEKDTGNTRTIDLAKERSLDPKATSFICYECKTGASCTKAAGVCVDECKKNK